MERRVISDNHIRKVVIVGGGTAGWMAAAVLSRVMGKVLDIEVIESESIRTVGVGEATIPQIRLLVAALGLDEHDFLRNVQGSIKLGVQFCGWTRPGHTYLHGFGPIGRSLGTLPFYQYWLRGVQSGGASDLWSYSTTAQAANLNRFAGGPRTDDLSAPVFAYHFDAALVGEYLRKYAEQRGVVRTEGMIVDTILREPDGFIAAVVLEGERRIPADLFIDCSGFRGLLIEQALKTGYEDWSHWLPVDRALAIQCESVEPLTPYTRATAQKAGWIWRIPLQHRTGTGHVYCSRYTSDDEAAAALLASLDGKAIKEPWPLKFVTGRRKQAWNKNCVALGLASGFLEPLESTSIHFIQSGISRLVGMFPDMRFSQFEIDEYNRQSALEFEHTRDFIALHYYANERPEPFWQHCREMPLPPGLKHRLDLFRLSGRIYREPDDLFLDLSWLQVMLGQNVTPVGHHPAANVPTQAQLDEFLTNVRAVVERSVGGMPSLREFLNEHCRATDG